MKKNIKYLYKLIYFYMLIFFLFLSPPLSKTEKKLEYFFAINENFDENKIIWEIKNTLEPIKKCSKSTREWIYKLVALLSSYRGHFKTLTIIKRNYKFEAILTTRKGEIFFFKNGKILPPDVLHLENEYSSYFYYYPIGHLTTYKPRKENFPKPANHSFFTSLYGLYPEEIENDLELFKVMNRRLRFHKAYNASLNLKKSLAEIENESYNDEDIKLWLSSIQNIYTYKNRTLRNNGATSLHSYGIALDILPYKRDKHIYWLWAKEYRKDFWNIKEEEKNYVPEKVIDIFEKNGFIWGGKWYFFDRMHFEYRPEIINYMKLLKKDPLK